MAPAVAMWSGSAASMAASGMSGAWASSRLWTTVTPPHCLIAKSPDAPSFRAPLRITPITRGP